MSILDAKIALVGLGAMGEALLSGLLSNGVVDASQVVGIESYPPRAEEVGNRYGISIAFGIEGASGADIVIVAVKPKDAGAVASAIGPGRLVVSICAGLTLDFFASRLPPETAVVRVMPNTPALVGQGASAWVANQHVTPLQADAVKVILGSLGREARVEDEKLMDAVTGLSGSGPAYVLIMIEALADGGVAAGLPRALARELAAQTVLGAAAMALGNIAHTAELKDRVCSPGGTTIEGVRKLEAAGIRSALIEAVVAASKRSKELGS